MDYEQALQDVIGEQSEDGQLTDSESVYLEFRGAVEPGLFDANFDLLPAKSTSYGYTDQTLRGHILNGAAFAARLNHALRELDPGAALSDEELCQAMALFTVHDLHKTPEAQARREAAASRDDADKDITQSEIEEYVSTLQLEELATSLGHQDYRAAAVGTEEGSGRHRGATSRTYARIRPWLRLMDAAASTADPSDADSLNRRLNAISEEVAFAHHLLSDTKGITTNFLTSAVVEYVEEHTDAKALVHFANGTIYLAPSESNLSREIDQVSEVGEALTDQFISTLRANIDAASTIEDTRQTLVDKLNYGFMEFSRPTYLLYGFDEADEALQTDLVDRMSGEPTLYSQYQLGVTAAYGANVVSELPSDWRTGQAATVYLSTLFKELFDPLEGGDTQRAIQSIADALGVAETADWLHSLDELSWQDTISETRARTLAEHMPASVNEVQEEANEGINLTYVNRFATPLALAYIEDGADGSLTGVPTEGVLSRLSNRLVDHFRSWDPGWDSHRTGTWESDRPNEEKAEAFLKAKVATVRDAVHQYITDTVILFQRSLENGPSSKSKLEEYSSQYQPHICLLCNTLLTGSGSKSDFETSQDTVGLSMRFSHLAEISAEGGEPDALACPMCELEMVIRNSVHDFNDEDVGYLFLAPDYFHAPADIAFQRAVRDYLFASEGYNLFQVAQRLLATRPNERSLAASDLLELLSPEDDLDEFRNSFKSYDSAFDDTGSLGVFRLDPPRREPGSRDPVTRVPREMLNLATTLMFAWFTSSRVLLTSRPVPMRRFEEFDEMVQAVDTPAELQALFGSTTSISALRDLEHASESCRITILNSGPVEVQDSEANTALGDDAANSPEAADQIGSDSDATASSVRTYELRPRTELEERLYQVAGVLTVTFRAHGTEVQRLKSTVSAMQEPFPGASSLLKGDETQGDYDALNAANVLDTLTHRQMSNSIEQLADAGFRTVRPDIEKDSNYNYERLFRVAREAVSGNIMQNASPEELETIVTGQVMKAAARAETSAKYSEEGIKREAAEQFADVFVNQILLEICDGDFYQLRRHENSLAAGYNAAIRRKEAEAFADHSE